MEEAGVSDKVKSNQEGLRALIPAASVNRNFQRAFDEDIPRALIPTAITAPASTPRATARSRSALDSDCATTSRPPGGHTQRLGYYFYGQAFETQRFLNTPEPAALHDSGKGALAAHLRPLSRFKPRARAPAAFDQIHTAVGGLTWRERRSGFFASAAFEYGSGTPATFPGADGEEPLVRLPGHFVANLYFGVELLRHERRGLRLQLNVENLTDRVFRIARESEFTPVQYSPPRLLSGSMRVRF